MKLPVNPGTTAVRSAMESDTQFGAIVPPLHLSSNFSFKALGSRRQYDYTRSGNPTRDALADALAELEQGAAATVTASGMAAIALVTQPLKPGDVLLAPHDCYGGTQRLLRAFSAKGHFRVEFADQSAGDIHQRIIELGPRLVLVETPSNPLLRITDIRRVVSAARHCNSLVAVDNTFLSPMGQQPIALGADLVIHSTTKYLNGHSDVVGGAVISASAELGEQMAWWSNCLGLSGAPFDSYLTLRGVRTLRSRLRQHEENAARIAALLATHEAVRQVYYPGLPDHPGHDLARSQQQGFGGMISIDLHGGEAAASVFVDRLRLFSLAESLGGVESLVAHPATMTHASLTPEALRTAGISRGLVRLSVGIEDGDDLVADVRRALNVALTETALRRTAVA